jgi:hypothetical protein
LWYVNYVPWIGEYGELGLYLVTFHVIGVI